MTLDAVIEDGIQGSKNGNGENSEEINATVQERSNRILNLISGTGDGVDMGTFMRYLGIQRSVCTDRECDIREESEKEN